MVDLQWRFPKIDPSAPNQESLEWHLMGGDGDSINTGLVREAVQNSLDAALSRHSEEYAGEPVRMRFSLAGIQAPLPPDRAARYFAGLTEHLRHLRILDGDLQRRVERGDVAAGAVPFIVIEDSGTTGLTGCPAQTYHDEFNKADDNYFYWFFRNIGRSGKSGNDNGSWGLGKWVFASASQINSCIGVTRRWNDGETLLFGQAVAGSHQVNGNRFHSYGYFSIPGEPPGPSMPLLRSDESHRPYIDQCIADFRLRLRDKPGLSVIVPFPRVMPGGPIDDEEVDGVITEQLLKAAVLNYFHPIINGRLIITVDSGNSPEVVINADTIDGVTESLNFSGQGEDSAKAYRKLFDLCRTSVGLPQKNYISLQSPRLPEQELEAMRARYNAGELLAFDVRSEVREKPAKIRKGTHFSIYLQRDGELDSGHDHFVRGTLSITERDYIQRHQARSLLLVNEQEPMAAMLRDSEPPAHNRWFPDSPRVKGNWVAAPRIIREVLNYPARLLRLLEAPTEELQKEVFADIFFVPERKPIPPVCGGDGNNGKKKDDHIAPPNTASLVRISRLDDGFQVRLLTGSRSKLGAGDTLRLRAAYSILRVSNPLTRYRPEDFRLHGDGAVDVAITGAEASYPGPFNEIHLRITDAATFSLAAHGFDPNRDLHIRVDKLASNQQEQEEGGTDD